MTTFKAPKRTTILAHPDNYTKGRIKGIRLLVVHDGETGEGSTPAEGMGYWFQRKEAGGSAHGGFDTDSICTYVRDKDTAYGAPSANADGLHGELAGRANQSASQWKDDDSLRIIENAAIWFAENSIEHSIPARWLTDAQLRDGKTKGFTTHRQCTRAFGGSHTDPGPNFPTDYFMTRVKFHIARLTGKPVPPVSSKEITVLTLVQVTGQDPVWVSDIITRRWVQTPADLKVVQANMKARGLSTAIVKVKSLTGYGVAVGPVPK